MSITKSTIILTIQRRTLSTPFDVTDVIPLGFTCKLNGSAPNSIQIATSEVDGMFENTDFWLRETVGSVVTYYDIKNTPYTFTINNNVINDTTRFAIVFTNNPPRLDSFTSTFSATVSPNPYTDGFGIQVITSSEKPIHVAIYDLLGKLVETGTYSPTTLETLTFGKTLAAGLYQAVVTQGTTKETLKVIKK